MALSRAEMAIQFEGNHAFSATQLRAALRYYGIVLQEPIDAPTADDAAYYARQFYFEQGYPDAEVDYTYRNSPPEATLHITEGQRVFVKRLTFRGNRAFTSDRLREIFVESMRRRTGEFFGRLRYVETAVEDATQDLVGAYAAKGYLDAVVLLEGPPGDPVGDVELDVEIREGPLFTVQAVRIHAADPEIAKWLADQVGFSEGAVFHADTATVLRTRLLDELHKRGFLRAEVAVSDTKDPLSGATVLTAAVEPGEQYRYAGVVVSGNERTLSEAVRRWLRVKPGSVVNVERLDDGERRLWESGVFAEIEAEPEPAGPGKAILKVNIREARSKILRGFAGYGQWDGPLGGITYADRDLFGTLNRLDVETYFSTRNLAGTATLGNPYFLGSDALGRLGAGVARVWVPAYRAFVFSGLAGLEWRQSTAQSTGISIQYSWRAIRDSEVFGDATDSMVDYQVGALAFRQTLDRRNDPLTPMQGYFLQNEMAIADPALLGEISFLRVSSQITHYWPLIRITPEKPFVPFFALNHRVGAIVPFGGTGEVPVQERFFLGGPDTVRGFQLDGLGPRDDEATPLGGQAFVLGNAELQWPLWQSFYVVSFADSGNLSPTVEDFAFDAMRLTFGGGVRLYTPIGAVRLDYGYNVVRDDGDPIGNWQFGFGFTF